ncbi:MAG: hypothetical protein AABY11_03235, partial [archaeon]
KTGKIPPVKEWKSRLLPESKSPTLATPRKITLPKISPDRLASKIIGRRNTTSNTSGLGKIGNFPKKENSYNAPKKKKVWGDI